VEGYLFVFILFVFYLSPASISGDGKANFIEKRNKYTGNKKTIEHIKKRNISRKTVFSSDKFEPVPLISKNIRIAVSRGLKSFALSGKNIRIYDFSNKKTVFNCDGNCQLKFLINLCNIPVVNNTPVKSDHLILLAKPEQLSINNKPYRGIFDLYVENGSFLIVNHIKIDKYLAALLNREMNASWPIETLKAQAIAARTYAFACMIENIDRRFDVEADVRDQVYDGSKFEAKRTHRAVEESRGKVLTYRGQVLKTYYHANSGGYTENPSRIWGGDSTYMPAVNDPYAFNLPGYSWELKLPVAVIKSALVSNGYPFSYLFNISVINHTPSGRVKTISIETEDKNFYISGNLFREFMGPGLLKSTRFIITEKTDDKVVFTGRGMGHGAGLSQWGARKMGEIGLSHRDILKKYYPELTITKLW